MTENDCPKAWTNPKRVLNVVHGLPGEDVSLSRPKMTSYFPRMTGNKGGKVGKSRKRLFPGNCWVPAEENTSLLSTAPWALESTKIIHGIRTHARIFFRQMMYISFLEANRRMHQSPPMCDCSSSSNLWWIKYMLTMTTNFSRPASASFSSRHRLNCEIYIPGMR